MKREATLSIRYLNKVKKLYLKEMMTVKEVAVILKVHVNAVDYFIRKHNIPKRNFKEAQYIRFVHKPLSFKKSKIDTPYLKELAAVGTMLYWAEGYKGNEKSVTVDFANSDPKMIKIFLKFLREIYNVDENKLRVYLYCYSDQNIKNLIDFWQRVTFISKSQFSKPYVRSDFKETGRKMQHGMIHVRYHDKKLLLEIKNMIESYVKKYASVV